ncbi:hypothetical protein LRD69_01760 [Streptomyces sp. JH14]|uniref:hypothetical protein n=1 Tax=Streptomyces sp. JH14 TaxID=2793630 RepID=UPI0023F7311E|nr:hypothetical protein [Streptomyces sp. JH14]MDF6040913.1 hypothetical protein [Streptomyces sp. JH14]
MSRRRTVVAVAGLSLALFAFATVEALPVGLLPQIAHGRGTARRHPSPMAKTTQRDR